MFKALMKICLLPSLLFCSLIGWAAVAPVTLSFDSGTTSFTVGSNGTANYVVTLNPSVPTNESMSFKFYNELGSTSLVSTQITTGSSPCVSAGAGTLCGNSFSLRPGQSCCLALSLGSTVAGTVTLQPSVFSTPYRVYGANAVPLPVTVTPSSGTTSLSVFVATLALSVNCQPSSSCTTTQNAALTGNARHITITNTGSNTATDLNISYPTWPTGTSATSTCGSSLQANATCTITITPGNTATAGSGGASCATGLTPVPGTITISASNASSVTSNVSVLTYGCLYQGGYLFSINDATPSGESIGGSVVASTDQAPVSPGIIWSSNSSGTYDGGVAIYGIANNSTTSSPSPSSGQVSGQVACNGNTSGNCDTNNIYVYYQNDATGAPINLSYYAAGLCKQTISGYSNWYLPAVCEMGYDSASSGSGCGTSGAPTLQNIQSNLVDPGVSGSPIGYYQSATEYSLSPQHSIYFQYFSGSGGSFQGNGLKSEAVGVRCVRIFGGPS